MDGADTHESLCGQFVLVHHRHWLGFTVSYGQTFRTVPGRLGLDGALCHAAALHYCKPVCYRPKQPLLFQESHSQYACRDYQLCLPQHLVPDSGACWRAVQRGCSTGFCGNKPKITGGRSRKERGKHAGLCAYISLQKKPVIMLWILLSGNSMLRHPSRYRNRLWYK
jgi:hypothetical protein